MTTRPPVNVTEPSLPPIEDVHRLLQESWSSRILTNGGPLHQRLEKALEIWLEVPHVSLFNNGTIALMAALASLERRGDVITTPFSFVATAHACQWAGNRPVFVDVDPDTLNLDPNQVREAVTKDTVAILPVHCYGNPCDTAAFDAISEETGVPVIYDAAHAFGVLQGKKPLVAEGDLSVLSFHATKVFSTVEGGAIVSHDAATKERIDRLRNFGIRGESEVLDVGLNGKLSEVHCAFGLAQLPYVEGTIEARSRIAQRYRAGLAGLPGIVPLQTPPGVRQNHGYFPMLVTEKAPVDRDGLHAALHAQGIRSRRYFSPLIPHFEVYRGLDGSWPVAERAARQVLCLPLFAHMPPDLQDRVLHAVRTALA